VVKNCSVCNRLQRSKQPQKQTKLRPMTKFRPIAVLHADLVGPIPPGRNSQGQRGFQYILSVVDSATRYLWLLPLRHKTADEVAAVLCEQVILRVSCPSAIITDQGNEFSGAVVQAVCDKLGITRLRTSGYHPRQTAKQSVCTSLCIILSLNCWIRSIHHFGWTHWDLQLLLITAQFIPLQAFVHTSYSTR